MMERLLVPAPYPSGMEARRIVSARSGRKRTMTEDTPNPQDEYAQVLQGRLGKFSKRINLRVADLTGWPEIAESDDPQELIK